MGLKIFTSETNKYSKSVTYEEIIEGMRQGKYKMTYTDIRLEAEIIFLIEKRKIKIEEDDLLTVSDEVSRKIRQGKRTHATLKKIQKKPWPE